MERLTAIDGISEFGIERKREILVQTNARMMLGFGLGRRTAAIFRDCRTVMTCSGGGRVGDEVYVTPIVVAVMPERKTIRERKMMSECDIVAGFCEWRCVLRIVAHNSRSWLFISPHQNWREFMKTKLGKY